MIYESYENYTKEVRITNHLIGGRVDGVLISASAQTQNIEYLSELLERKINLLMFDRVFKELDVIKVSSNDYESSIEATQHLINNGCKKILFLKAGESLSTMTKRVKGYQDALSYHHIPHDKGLIKTFHPSEDLNLDELAKIIKTSQPDAIFCSVENLAIACYDVCKKLMLKIPDDLKIITFSNLKVARHLSPSLSTISQPAFEIGKIAATLLIDEKIIPPVKK